MPDRILHPAATLRTDTGEPGRENWTCMMSDSEAPTREAASYEASTREVQTHGVRDCEVLRIVVVGMPLSGKSSVYRRLLKENGGGVDCPKFDANGSSSTSDMCTQSRVVHPESGLASMLNLYELDAEIETNAGKSIPEIFSEKGEAGFRVHEREMLRRLLMLHETTSVESKDSAVLKDRIIIVFSGGGAVQSPETREVLKRFDKIVYLRTSLSALLLRMSDEEMRTRPLFSTNSPEETLERLYEMRTRLYEELATDVIDTDGRTVEEVAEVLIKMVQKMTSESEF